MDTKYRAQFKRHGMRKISKKTVFAQKENLQRILCKNKRNYCQTVTLGFTSWIADAIESTLEKQKKKKNHQELWSTLKIVAYMHSFLYMQRSQ